MGKPLDVATLMETDMDTSPQDAALQAWKRQIDAGFRVIDVLTEGAERPVWRSPSSSWSSYSRNSRTSRSRKASPSIGAV